MSTEPTIDPIQLQDEIITWLAIDSGRKIVFIGFTLLIYEYFITLDKEVQYFWSAKWTPSRVLYLMLCVYPSSHFYEAHSLMDSCDHIIRGIFGLSTVALFTIQGILVVRVFYMFDHSLIARVIIAFAYAAAIASTITALALVMIGAVGYTEIGSGLFTHPGINIPAIFANLILVATSISISRVMLSFHDLAEHLRNNPNRLGHINSIPMNRVNWRKGSRDGEYVVTGTDHTSIISPSARSHLDIE
ncbi:hypothetical protein H0H92_000496 [Tricholoma furcatifolium]|nr:hypothetical protein H0H92_000496 [Tricholoma furcatifolium]